VAFANGNAIEVPQNDSAGPEWLNNKLTFNKENLQDIIAELNRQYNVNIVLQGKPSSQLFTGVLPMKNLDEALAILGSIYHLHPVTQKGKIILETL
jgi:ferric-dicitrate binding protein FerR (iron transport regulator)